MACEGTMATPMGEGVADRRPADALSFAAGNVTATSRLRGSAG